MSVPRLVIRADGGETIGAGHLGRSLALAQAWLDRHGTVTLLSESVPEPWARRFRDEGVVVTEPAAEWFADGADWIALDGYELNNVEAAIRDSACRLLVVDDFGTGGPHLADLVLDQNLDVDSSLYGGQETLAGPGYALLRREFAVSRSPERPIPAVARTLLLVEGGFPGGELRQLLADVIARPELADLEVERLEGRDEVASAMALADIALGAAGSTAWELCCMGVPAVLVTTAANQVPVAAAVAARGASIDSGPVGRVEPGALAGMVTVLAGDRDRRRSMSGVGQRLVDGRGAGRVVTRLRADMLSLRPAGDMDVRLLWEWANDPDVRRRAFSSDPIPWEEHTAWFAARMRDPNCRIYLATWDGGDPIGQVRFEGDGDAAEISVSVASAARGRGWGGALVDSGVRRLFADTRVQRVDARIKPDNMASGRAFDSAAFEFTGEESVGALSCLRYARSRHVSPR
ncbi:MAG: UDP-2,4-diacetamido-2,4, 6-trideoxy-beta-L-altropyranose hydrolase [Acidimicrobiales bacterium]|nr:UDP-2,4-diacetamido-2,4, 6-trideoxy-beta-L-altropyranose hydrolase [Acidimicrobiales bacterium]